MTDWYAEVAKSQKAEPQQPATPPARDIWHDEQGKPYFDIPGWLQNGMIGGAISGAVDAAKLPGDVLAGEARVEDPETMRRITSLAMLATPMPASMRAGERAIPGVGKALRQVVPQAPTSQALKAAGSKGFDTARSMGVDYSAASVKSMSDDLKSALEGDGFLSELSPKTFSIINKLGSPPEGSVASISGLVAARRALQNAAGDIGNPTEKAAATRAIQALDDFLGTPPTGGVVAGDAAGAAKLLEEARGNYAAGKRSEALTRVEQSAEGRTAAANSGRNLGNTLRSKLESVLESPKKSRGFSQQELDRMSQIVLKTGNKTRAISNKLAGGGGVGQFGVASIGGAGGAAIGGLLGGPVGATIGGGVGATLPPAIGAGARSIYNNMVKKAVGGLDEATRQRSPLFEQLLKNAPKEGDPPIKTAVFMRLLMQTLQSDKTAKNTTE